MKQKLEDKLDRMLEALEHPSSFTSEELEYLFSDKECLENARAILYAKEALARKYVSMPDVNKEWEAFARAHKKHSKIPVIIGLSAAVACIVLCFLLGHWENVYGGLQVFEAKQVAHTIKQEIVNGVMTIYIPRGMQKEVKLPDGTRVILNAESQLTYNTDQFGQKKRIVMLKGEGLFDVAKDSLHPFVVQSGHLSTQVLGTVFNLRSYEEEEMKITLLSGSLKVISLQKKNGLLIKPGEQAVFSDKQELYALETLQAKEFTSWTEGSFYFDDETLMSILCELGRWYNVNVVFKNREAMNYRLHFKASRKESLSSIVELLNYVSKSAIAFSDNTIIVGK